jgi:hypothetical protein
MEYENVIRIFKNRIKSEQQFIAVVVLEHIRLTTKFFRKKLYLRTYFDASAMGREANVPKVCESVSLTLN